ncbi:sigma-E factor negative regulatory protein [Thermithiobacillus plumbiphilus]|uniref:RseA family anti-sigma factor n=1 Tax=Thermithiobacillus plumbiphilus TaxID=1729899 RepID=A0ABU9DEN4_9PROT
MLNDKEKMSAFMDGELGIEDASIFIDRLLSDSELKKEWSRLHTVSHLLKYSQRPAALGSEAFASRVYNLLEQEPTVLAPKGLEPRHAPLPLWGKFGAVAIAASVGFVSFVMLQPGNPAGSAFDNAVSSPVANSMETQDDVSPAAMVPASDRGRQWAPVDLAPESSLEMYLARQRAQDLRMEEVRKASEQAPVVQKVGREVAH